MQTEWISVIVPVYNVEHYLNRCVDSILAQTYSDLEILLVDDGSTDNSGAICDVYARQDARVQVIHKKNGGLSDARNCGIEHAKGRYFCFVDSDDGIAPQMIEVLYRELLENAADISAVGWKAFDTEAFPSIEEQEASSKILQPKEAIRQILCSEELGDCAWNKLYKCSLFQEIQYPYGRMLEDLGTTYRLFEKCVHIVYCPVPLYFYYQRPDTEILRRQVGYGLSAVSVYPRKVPGYVGKRCSDDEDRRALLPVFEKRRTPQSGNGAISAGVPHRGRGASGQRVHEKIPAAETKQRTVHRVFSAEKRPRSEIKTRGQNKTWKRIKLSA